MENFQHEESQRYWVPNLKNLKKVALHTFKDRLNAFFTSVADELMPERCPGRGFEF